MKTFTSQKWLSLTRKIPWWLRPSLIFHFDLGFFSIYIGGPRLSYETRDYAYIKFEIRFLKFSTAFCLYSPASVQEAFKLLSK